MSETALYDSHILAPPQNTNKQTKWYAMSWPSIFKRAFPPYLNSYMAGVVKPKCLTLHPIRVKGNRIQ